MFENKFFQYRPEVCPEIGKITYFRTFCEHIFNIFYALPMGPILEDRVIWTKELRPGCFSICQKMSGVEKNIVKSKKNDI